MIINGSNYKQFHIGTKAENLFSLSEQGYSVPPFFCVNEDFKEEEITDYIKEYFPDTNLFSVRSSSSVEDSTDLSFAGQFETFLYVKKEDVVSCVKKVLSGTRQESVLDYCGKNKIAAEDIKMTVMIQEMIEADCSGVLFTANPQGILNETVLVLGRGTGENVVEDKVDTTTYYYNLTDRIFYYEKTNDSPLLSEMQIEEMIKRSEEIRGLFDTECDMEFAIKNGQFYLLQVRPITTFEKDGKPVILDNSNIVESYPGITLPLTQSFVKEVYYKVFRSVLLRLTREEKTVGRMEDTLRNMVDVANGRVYYRISNWYDVILLLPFSSKIIPVWQEMLGVKNKTVSRGKKAGFITHVKTTFSFFYLLVMNPKKMEELDVCFSEVLSYFDSLKVQGTDNETLIGYYQKLETMVTDKWDITLVNDMYSFIFTGLLKARLKKKNPENFEVLTNRYISKIADIESLKPMKELIALSNRAKEENRIEELKELKTNEDFERYMEKEDSFRQSIKQYINLYGDRNIEELKLESKTFRTDPVLFINRILQYSEEKFKLSTEPEEMKPLTGISKFLANKAALGIRNREKSRLNRSRLYGMMRCLMLQIGENLYKEGSIEAKEDIFWLYFDEVKKVSKKEETDVKKRITDRKKEYRMFESLPAYTRLVFSGKVTDKHPQEVSEMQFEKNEEHFFGTACSNGCVEGEVLIIEKPAAQMDTKDKVLVTKMTDPGWVFLIADAKGIIAEKGSLLSHTAIISRELGKPAVVGVKNITKLLKKGDYVRIDGEKGEITILKTEK